MTRKISLYLGATALALVLGAPAFAQTVITQENGSSVVPSQSDINTAVILAPGSSVSSFAAQTASTLYNAVGPTGSVGLDDPYTIDQAAGTFNTTGGVVHDTVNSTAVNIIGAGNDAYSGLSDVSAGGNQSASNAVNLANFAPPAASTGTLTQVVGTATLNATNRMFGVVNNGNVSVIGTDGNGGAGFQQAVGTLNTAGVYLTLPSSGNGDATDLTLTQKLTDDNSVTAVNSAIANSIASGSTILDPSVQNIDQSSAIGVNQLDFATATDSSATVGLDGAQNGITTLAGTNDVGTLTNEIGNTAVAYAGPIDTTGYDLFSSATGSGSASVSGVTQNASFGLNNVFGDAGTSIALSNTLSPEAGFTQSVDGTATSGGSTLAGPTGSYGNVYPNVINGIAARADSGSASITGVARAQASDPFTQSFLNQQNSVATGGTLSGSLTQNASDFAPLAGGTITGVNLGNGDTSLTADSGYYNVAIADVNTGPSSITDVSQDMTQSLNTVQAAPSSGLSLAQNATNVGLASNNLQLASGSSNATISGAQQLLNTSVNIAQLGAMSGSITQIGTDVELSNTNTLAAASGFNASVAGAQSATSAVNVIK